MSNKPQIYSPNRYDWDGCGSMEIYLDGEYVKYEDAEALLNALTWIRQYCVITKPENIDKQLIIAKCKEVLEDE